MSTQTSQPVVSAPVSTPVAQQTPAPVSTPSPVPQTLSSSSSSSMSTRSNHSHTNIANDEYIPPYCKLYLWFIRKILSILYLPFMDGVYRAPLLYL